MGKSGFQYGQVQVATNGGMPYKLGFKLYFPCENTTFLFVRFSVADDTCTTDVRRTLTSVSCKIYIFPPQLVDAMSGHIKSQSLSMKTFPTL